jgi:hypothetical protein
MLGFKKKYDVVFGIGAACSCTMSLRAAGLQYLSFPYDWLYGSTVERRMEILCNDFSGFLDVGDLTFLQKHLKNGMDIYKNEKTGMVFNHDFQGGMELSESFKGVARKYDRRITRLLTLLRTARSVLVVYMDPPGSQSTDIPSIIEAQRILQQRYSCRVDFVFFKMQREGFSDQMYGANVRVFSFDYQDHSPGVDVWDVDNKAVAKLLSKFYRCRDYRTREERKNQEIRLRRQKYERVGADSAWKYFIRRTSMNLNRFMMKYIKREY